MSPSLGRIHRAGPRGSSGDGRVYTITYEAEDGSGNVKMAQTFVTVPHDQRP